jgi:hypothetical protein
VRVSQALRMQNSLDIFHHPDPTRADGGFLLPFHVDTGIALEEGAFTPA